MNSSSGIESIGVRLPELKESSNEVVGRMKPKARIKLELITGIKERHICDEHEGAHDLAVDAARDCLRYSAFKAEAIEMLLYCGISKLDSKLLYTYEPSFSSSIKHEIGANRALSFDLSNACAGMMTGMYIANNFISRGIVKNCMVISGEYISSVCTNAVKSIKSSKSGEMASLTIGDAGAAVILDKHSTAFEALELQTFGQYSHLCIGQLSPKYRGAQMFTQMRKLHQVSLEEGPVFVENCLLEQGLTYDDIDYLIPHQTSKRALSKGGEVFKRYFGSEPKDIISNLEKIGNTASTTHILALYSILKQGLLKNTDRVLLLSFASGLVIGAAVFTVKELREKYGH